MKKIIVYTSLLITTGLYAQPNGSCSTGTTKYSDTGKIYGCVEGKWRPLAETAPTTSINMTGGGLTQRIGNTVYAKENGKAYDMKNVGFTPIDINGVEHQIGKIIYSSTNKHFYQGVENNKWWQLDSEYPFDEIGNKRCKDGSLPILDRNYHKDPYHKFVYCTIKGQDGRIWLNNNLGAEYAWIYSENFAPAQQAKDMHDYLAFGSLFQWQRKADGHELIEWLNNKAPQPRNGTTETLATSWYDAKTNKYIRYIRKVPPPKGNKYYNSSEAAPWNVNYEEGPHNLWQKDGANNPCPIGFHVPTVKEWVDWHNAVQGKNVGFEFVDPTPIENDKIMRFTKASMRSTYVSLGGWGESRAWEYGYYWSSSWTKLMKNTGPKWISEMQADYFAFNMLKSGISQHEMGFGMSIRCIKDR